MQIQIDAVPNQSFSTRLDDSRYVITLKETRGCMSATIVRDEVVVVSNARIVAGTPILPYEYQEQGNFIILTEDGDLPDWTKFGISQSLHYLSVAEIEAINAGN